MENSIMRNVWNLHKRGKENEKLQYIDWEKVYKKDLESAILSNDITLEEEIKQELKQFQEENKCQNFMRQL